MDTPKPVRRDLIQALIAILSQGIQDNALDDSEQLLSALRSLNPALHGLEEFASYIAIKRGYVHEALQLYATAPSDSSKWYVMMALCLKLTGDPTWHWHALQSLERQDESARYAHNLANILLGVEAKDPAETQQSAAAVDPAVVPGLQHDYIHYLSV